MANENIRNLVKSSGLKFWEVAYALGMNDGNFSRLLRVELSDEKRQQVETAIDELVKEKMEG